jgi:hypothetical protein
MEWTHKNLPVDTIPDDVFGFVYELTYKSGMRYIGKKQVHSYNEKTALKSGKPRKGHIKFLNRIKKSKRVAMELVATESKWRNYESSSKDIDPEDKVIAKTILFYSHKKQYLSYLEDRELFKVEACINDNYYNKNIAGRYFSNLLDDKE